MREKISLVSAGKPTPGQGTFGHIAGGYDAGYYGYTYSLVFAADMYATVFKADPLDPARGQRYRDNILLPGGSQDDIESLKVRHVESLFDDKWLIRVHRTSSAASPTRRRSSRSCLAIASPTFERSHC